MLCLSTDNTATIIDTATFFVYSKELVDLVFKNISVKWPLKTNTLFDLFIKIRVLAFLISFFKAPRYEYEYIFFRQYFNRIWHMIAYMNWRIFWYEIKKTCFIRLMFLKFHLAVANNFFSYSGLSSFINDTNKSK